MLTLLELKERIIEHYDPDLVVEVLEISTEQLLNTFEDELEAHRHKFKDLEEEGNQ
jgi:hypothetical protein